MRHNNPDISGNRLISGCELALRPSNRRCWAASLGGCTALSKEHVLSRAAFRKSPMPIITVIGFAPIPDGPIGRDSPKSRILCEHHNSLLSVLDSEIAQITGPILDFYSDRKDRSISASGFRFERWVYKVVLNFMAAGYADGERWDVDEEMVRFVFGETTVCRPLGMHMLREWKLEFGPPLQHMGVCPVYFGHSLSDAGLVGAVVTYHGLSFLACLDRTFDSMLEARPQGFPISPEILSYRPAAAVIFSKSTGAKFELAFDWT